MTIRVCCMSMSDDLGKTEYTYNQMDYRVYVKDPLGNTTKYCFDRLCNLVQLICPNQLNEKTGEGVGTKYLYDEMDEQIRRIDPLGNVFAMVRDLEGRVIREIHPESYDGKTGDGDGVCYEYDPDGRQNPDSVSGRRHRADFLRRRTEISSKKSSRSSMTGKRIPAWVTAMIMTVKTVCYRSQTRKGPSRSGMSMTCMETSQRKSTLMGICQQKRMRREPELSTAILPLAG